MMSGTLQRPVTDRPATRVWLSPTMLLIAPAFIWLFVFLVLPYLNIIVMSVRMPARVGMYAPGYTLQNYTHILSDPYYLGVLGQTLAIGVATTLSCLVLGLPVALQLARSHSRWTGLLYILILSPLLVGVVVRSFGWLIILSRNGVINATLLRLVPSATPLPLMNNEFGVIVGLTHVFLPMMILPLLASAQAIDPSLARAARSLGAGRLTAFRRITLPLCVPGIQAGGILVFVLSISAYVTPVMLGGARVRTMPVLIVQQLIDNFQWPSGAALALILAASATCVVLLFVRLTTPLVRGLQ